MKKSAVYLRITEAGRFVEKREVAKKIITDMLFYDKKLSVLNPI